MKLKTSPALDSKILSLVNQERKYQDTKWGIQEHDPHKWMSIITEEVGEAAEAILKGDYDNACVEFIQIAAVAVAIAGAIEEHCKEVLEKINAESDNNTDE